MKTRTPISIYIAVTVGLTIMAFEMFSQDGNYFSSPYFWVLLIITIILLFILNSIGDLIENENFSRLTEEEKSYTWKIKKHLTFKSYGILPLKNSHNLKKRIFLSITVSMELQNLTIHFQNGGSDYSGSDVYSVQFI
ncbi:hypothetical protein MUU74_07965 [Chryseobacterium daecheongense]|nr:hypothetical protein MUU74_07965 [Chryseobacterium daecheongense]